MLSLGREWITVTELIPPDPEVLPPTRVDDEQWVVGPIDFFARQPAGGTVYVTNARPL